MVGKLLADLRAAGQLDRTLVIVAADHGESLGEHGERTHGVFVYDVTMRVPWIIWIGFGVQGSGLRAGFASFDGLVRLHRPRADGARSGRRRRAAGIRRPIDRDSACGSAGPARPMTHRPTSKRWTPT